MNTRTVVMIVVGLLLLAGLIFALVNASTARAQATIASGDGGPTGG